MRAGNGLLAAAALAFVGLAPLARAEPMRQLVVQAALHGRDEPAAAARSRLIERIESLGLELRGALTDRLQVAIPISAAERPNPFGFDPDRIWLVEAPDTLVAAAAARVLARDPDVDWVEFNQRREAAVLSLDPDFPNDPMFVDTRQWGLHNLGPAGAYGGVAGADIHALGAWNRSVGGNDVRLAIADTGIDPDQPDLQADLPGGGTRVELGMNVTSEPSPAFTDSFGHGTPVAGVAAARTNDGAHFDSLGIAGVCGGDGHDNFGCRIVPIKIAPGHSGEATSYDISRAILYATQVGARAMNLSFAGSSPSKLERSALYYAITHGCVVVAAAGNRGGGVNPRAAQYPAAYSVEGFCVQVGASDFNDLRAAFSSYGPGVDLVAPGFDIVTTFMTYPSYNGAVHHYVVGSGTSFAAPHVTGAIGLMAAARPELTDTDFQVLLRESADDLDPPGVDEATGWGRLNADRALAAVPPSFGVWHDEAPAQTFVPESVDSLYLGERGPGNLDLTRGSSMAQVIQATATVAIPDSFIDSVRVWPRVGGTTTIRGDFRIPYFAPWATVVAQDPTSFTISGYLYHLDECLDCPQPDDAFLPLPPDEARFGFTVIGKVDRPPALALLAPTGTASAAAGDTLALAWNASDPDQITSIEVWLVDGGGAATRVAALPGSAAGARIGLPCPAPFAGSGRLRVIAIDDHGRVHDRTAVERPIVIEPRDCAARAAAPVRLESSPNPFHGALRITAPAGSRLTIVDVAGRVVRRIALPSGTTQYTWDGLDQVGRTAEPGLYLVRCAARGVRTQTKVLKLE